MIEISINNILILLLLLIGLWLLLIAVLDYRVFKDLFRDKDVRKVFIISLLGIVCAVVLGCVLNYIISFFL